MGTSRTGRGLLRLRVLSCLAVLLLYSTGAGVAASRRGLHPSSRHTGAHHRPLTDEQRADQNVQFMLSLYRSAAEPDGRPKQHRKFGSNTVRLLRPSVSSVLYLPASGGEGADHHYTFTVQYDLDTLQSEQLIKASFIHLRSPWPSTSSSSSTTSSGAQVAEPPRCRAQIAPLGPESLVTLEPHERWTETDITAHVAGHVLQRKGQGAGGHLTLTAQYWCTEPGLAEEEEEEEGVGGLWWRWWSRLRGRQREEAAAAAHLEVPSLLLYLEDVRQGKDWMGELLGAEGRDAMRQIERWHPSLRRRRRSKDSSSLSTSPSSTSPSAASIVSNIPNYKRKTGAPKNRCKLHSFRLSFDELGWGHYIAPPVYNPRFCQGDCPNVLHYGYNSPNHAIIQKIINDLGIGDVPPLSCVPNKYMPMSVLFMDKNIVDYIELDDMVAESCTCR
ncbi:bone morphogenetic protein 15 isoform X1 [Scophthalmus maximus]|uniref:bone morphogenetic protein 15 isoform X1 n=1 Tax=Scophthalmus maximus TaxID=52904 RepID=UPI001FA8BD43|nr:bone morphogenetic protein 15 isoform X1 [Scophthalmus maximus]